MTLYLRRRASFSAGFLQPPPGDRGGGHNYLCELAVGGPIDPATGMVVNIRDVDAVLKAQVVGPLDGRLLDRDVPDFQSASPTPERLTRWIWDRCAPALPPGCRLAAVTLWPTAALRAALSLLPPSGDLPVLTVTRVYDFSASHRLHSSQLSEAENAEIFGKCNWENGHGHNYTVEVTLAGEPDPQSGLIADTEALDRLVDREVLKPYDHRHLNHDAPEFRDLVPTSENLTRVIWDKLAAHLDGRLYRVVVRETERNYFEYYGETA